MTRLRKTLLWLLVAVILFTIAGFFVAPPVLRSVLVRKLSTSLDRMVSIGGISINPYTLGVRFRDITIGERSGPGTFFRVREIRARMGLSVVTGVITLDHLSLRDPHVNIIRHDDGSYNFSDLLDKKETPSGETDAGKEGITFSLRDIAIQNGSADFLDTPVKKKHALRELNLNVPLLSNAPRHIEKDVRPTLSFKLNDDPYVIAGRTRPFADSLETAFDINIQNVDIPHYLAYLPVKPRFSVPSGYLDIRIEAAFRQFKDKAPLLAFRGDMAVSKLVVNDDTGRTVVNLPALRVTVASMEPLAGKMELSKVFFESPEFTLDRDRNGTLNIMALLPKMKEKEKSEAGTREEVKAGREGDGEPFQFIVGSIELTGGKVLFTDRSLKDTAKITVEKLELKGEKITLAKGSPGAFSTSLVVNRKGTMKLEGAVALDPFSLKAKVDLKDIDIRPFQPYFTDRVRVSVMSGAAGASGDLLVTQVPKKGPSVLYKGSVSLAGLSSVDNETTENLLKLKSFHARNVEFGYNPTRITAKGVSLTDFYASIAVRPDKTVNLQHVIVRDDAAVDGRIGTTAGETTAPEKERSASAAAGGRTPSDTEESVPVRIDIVTLQGGTIRFHDQSVRPAFSTTLGQIAGRISGLSSQLNTAADVELRGALDNAAPLEITGKINPLSKNLYVDLKASFRDMDLTPATPYSGRYAGYTIDKGKLSFDVRYLMEQRKLDSTNTIFIDQLTLGERVESPDATKLPVKLAIALLKDRRGQIKLDLPVTGSLDDPEFSVGRIILKIIVNLLTKAATAPFALIGALFGSGEELGYIEFDYGRAVLNETGLKKISTLSKALSDKPSLKVDIEGYVDPERDREGLKQYLVQRKVKAQKLRDLMKKSTADIDVDDVKVEQGEYEKYLRLAYKAEKFPKPRNMIGLQKSLPVEEMEKLMLTNTAIQEEDLQALARRRSARVMQALVRSGQVEAGRLFIVDPRSIAPQKKEKLKDSRVEFKLK